MGPQATFLLSHLAFARAYVDITQSVHRRHPRDFLPERSAFRARQIWTLLHHLERSSARFLRSGNDVYSPSWAGAIICVLRLWEYIPRAWP
ncbi:hypothetical protein BD311DRAFT_751077 [Dichomitus squalens]|uniref:Uncharacterized protein n=1 Tax=Dichomitus squalens TaxID=114155 RepID=A0A4Q9MW98_9APHY|nr:hypothetical protein BD311DRAFT_751077 [Dichomitus squalens]